MTSLCDARGEHEEYALILTALEFFSRPSPSGSEAAVRAYVVQQLRDAGCLVEVDRMGNVLATRGRLAEGEGYPLLSFHMDTVADNVWSLHRWRQGKQMQAPPLCVSEEGIIHTNGQGILGGDDKCGGAIALSLSRSTSLPLKLVASVEEEIGCVGITRVDPHFFADVSYALVLDRRGRSDLITSISGQRLCTQTFAQQMIALAAQVGHQVQMTEGYMSDALILAESIAEVVNLSVGYYLPHSREEFVILHDLIMAYRWVKACLSSLPRPRPAPLLALSRRVQEETRLEDADVWCEGCGLLNCRPTELPLHLREWACVCEPMDAGAEDMPDSHGDRADA